MSPTRHPSGIVELPPGDPRLSAAWSVMAQLRPDRDAAAMDALYAEAHPLGYRLTALFDRTDCRAVAGWRYGVNLHLGRNLYVEDLVTAAEARSAGHGARLLDHLRGVARAAGCAALHLDSGVTRQGAHRFYFREGLHVSAFHFVEQL